ncbi:FMRFamide receptor [Nephila pilipes]|uniref:FMRFamide receptor n=1 Tax=Nephila pilipes TaxID=299642 RepID=A0A8X6Q7M7_NEPPI|nr:FMRFamide receptor [Nephila pilipes]GFU04482.1 FMRFamide receptor [Nephila pilipes]
MYDTIVPEGNCTIFETVLCNNTNCPIVSNDYNCSNSNWSAVVIPSVMSSDPDPSLEEFQLHSRFWIQRVLVPIIMIIGVIGNTITIFIMTQRRMRSSTNWYLAALAIFDMSYLIFSFLLSFQHYPHIHDAQFYLYWRFWPYMLTITDASSNSSIWITVTFTIERYIAVCHPMKGKVICTESRAKKMIIIVFLLCFFITLPTAFEWIILEKVDPVTNATQIQVDYSDLGNNPVYVTVYYWVISVLFVFIPLLLLAFFNAFLIKSVHSSKSRRKTMTRRRDTGDQSTQESKITVMLIAVVILFLVCQLPTAVILLYKAFHHVEHGSNEDLLLRGLGNIFNFLVAVNAAGNFVLYCLLSQKYRRTFLLIFCPCLKGKITRLHSVYQNTVYSTMDNESPAASRKYSVRAPKMSNVARDCSISMLNQANFGNQQQQKSASSTRQQQLSFSKKVAVFSDDNESPEDAHYCRLLRGFRWHWKRPKIATGPNKEERTGQFIPLKSPSKCSNFSPSTFSGTSSE